MDILIFLTLTMLYAKREVIVERIKRNERCIYCEGSKQTKDLHFACEICGAGMCDDCYDRMVEHDAHYHEILENCDDEREIRLILEANNGNDPAYICESCVNIILKS